jgi:NTE family protein
MTTPAIGLALSGGGSRAIAFHLGCLRALHDRGLLGKVRILSAVSGGSVIAAIYAYHDEPFEAFEKRVETLLRRGLMYGIIRQTFLSLETVLILAAMLSAGVLAALGTLLRATVALLGLFKLAGKSLPVFATRLSAIAPRFASRSTAFERHLRRKVFGDRRIDQVARPDLAVVLNAAELRTETAFRYGSRESGAWRFGRLVNTPMVSQAVAASAAFPVLLPAFDQTLAFEKQGVETRHRVMITDGGVYDNLGITCMLPGKSSEFSINAYPVTFIIACDAGPGTPSGSRRPYFWASRMVATMFTIHRRTQSLSQDLLHRMAATGEIAGFLYSYLGQLDERLPHKPQDLVTREKVVDYPTNFSPMTRANLDLLSRRGEQLTRILLDCYASHL